MKKICLTFLILLSARFLFAIHLLKTEEYSFNQEVIFFAKGENLGVITGKAKGYLIKLFLDKEKKEFFVRKGEGPGEILIPTAALFWENKIVIFDRLKSAVQIFDLEGKFIGEAKYRFKLKFPFLVNFMGDLESPLLLGTVFKKRGGEIIASEQALILLKGRQKVLKEVSGEWRKGERINLNRDFLLVSSDGKNIAFAKNTEYKIEVGKIVKGNFEINVLLEKEFEKKKWGKEYERLKEEVIPKEYSYKAEYPGFLPPIFAISLDGDYIAVALNEGIGRKKTVIELWDWRRKRILGREEIPLLYAQYDVVPSPLHINSGFKLTWPFLYSLHYSKKEDKWSIIKWKIIR